MLIQGCLRGLTKSLAQGLFGSSWVWLLAMTHPGWADIQLPPPDDLPEEVLRTEIIFDARSPIDGQPMSVADYAALQEELQSPPASPLIDSEIRSLLFLLQIRRGVKPILPFIP